MKKVRIIKKTWENDRITYIIQQKHFLFRWWWVDAWINSGSGAACKDEFDTEQEAKDNLWRFDGTKAKKEIVYDTTN